MSEELDPEFKRWLLWKVKRLSVAELLEDNVFIGRLMKDVVYGRSKRFNKNSRFKNRKHAGGLDFLWDEFQAEKLEWLVKKKMLMICAVPRCGGSLVQLRTPQGEVYYKCTRCSTSYSTPPKVGADYKKFLREKPEEV
jgi:tRNA(Ile2) C34 agmatinyltransferase TiaS